jgi:hypothetical protein
MACRRAHPISNDQGRGRLTTNEIPDELWNYFGKTPPPQPDNVIPITTPRTNGNGDHTAYTEAAQRAELNQLANCPPGGRNHALNITALKLARLPINRQALRYDLTTACTTNGLIHDDGLASVEATIRSAFDKADRDGPRDIPKQPNWEFFKETTAEDINGEDLTEDETRDLHQQAVARRAYEYRINDEARQLYQSQEAARLGHQRPQPVILADFLATPDEDATYRVNNLLPIGGRALLAAQYKAGKTSMVANLLRVLVDGGQFLGQYRVDPVTRVALIDTELDERMLRRWLRDQGIRTTKNVTVISLRGHQSTFDILNDATRAAWAETLKGSQLIILDCLRPCLDALGLSEDKDAGRFLVAFDELLKQSGAGEAIVVHHMGHNSERSRGDSRLLDWPDVLWKIIRENDEDDDSDNGNRFFSAIGRDVNVGEAQLDWTEADRSLVICGGGRADVRARDAVEDIIDILSRPENVDGLSKNQIEAKLKSAGVGRNLARRAIRQAIDTAVIYVTKGEKRSDVCILNPTRRPH